MSGPRRRRRTRETPVRNRRVGIKFSNEEYELVAAAARATGLSVAAFVALAAVTARSDPDVQPSLPHIPERGWQSVGKPPDPAAQLYTSVVANGVFLHVEAIAVTCAAGDQLVASGAVYDTRDLDAVRDAVGADGPFTTATISGREYVLIATPYS
jgi:hypothetical protein